jgi:solute carrier family 25 phosphate transporter 23/24/25/41
MLGLVRAYILPPSSTVEGPELVLRKLACGGLAGGTSLLFTHPFDVIRRKLQVVGMGGGNPEYNGAIDAIVKICKAEGFWKGM